MPEAKESPADRLKREAAEKEAAKAAKEPEEYKTLPDTPSKVAEEPEETPEQKALREEKEARFRRAEEFERQREEKIKARNAAIAGTVPVPDPDNASADPETENVRDFTVAQYKAGKDAADKLHKMAQGIPSSTPDEHVFFGLAGIRFTAGDLRAVTGMKRG